LDARRALFFGLCVPYPEDALDIMLDGILQDPFQVALQYDLSTWLVWRASGGDDLALQMFKGLVCEWRPHLEQNVRSQKALWILSQFFESIGKECQLKYCRQRMSELRQRGIGH